MESTWKSRDGKLEGRLGKDSSSLHPTKAKCCNLVNFPMEVGKHLIGVANTSRDFRLYNSPNESGNSPILVLLRSRFANHFSLPID